MKSINRVTLLGNIGKDPDTKTLQGGSSVTNFSIATTESYKDKQGNWQETTDWHNVVLWNNLSEVAEKYLSKGSKVLVEGRLKTSSYEQNGQTKYKTEVIGTNLILLDKVEKQNNDYKEKQEDSNDDDVPF